MALPIVALRRHQVRSKEVEGPVHPGRLLSWIVGSQADEVWPKELSRSRMNSLRNVWRSRLSLRMAEALATTNSAVGEKKEVMVMMSLPYFAYLPANFSCQNQSPPSVQRVVWKM